jgi:hypothetical protein
MGPLDALGPTPAGSACEVAPDGDRGEWRLSLRRTPQVWKAAAKAFEVRLVADRSSLQIGDLAEQGLARVYELDGVELNPRDP